jgi:exoribonuclease-2
VVHQQLRAFLSDQPLLDHEAMVERIGLADEGSFAARKAERQSNQHWKLLYLKQQQKMTGDAWQGQAIVVMQDERKTTLILPDLAIEPKIPKQNQLDLDQSVTLQMTTVNIADLYSGFKIVS